MLSRRSIRVKVMQILFALDRDKDLSLDEASKNYSKSISDCYNLLLFNLYVLIQLTKVSVEDDKHRKAKHLVTDEDSKFSAKLYQNEIIQGLVNNLSLEKDFSKHAFANKMDSDFYKKLYTDFSKNEKYLPYVLGESTTASHREILLEMYRFCRQDEYFNEIMDDHFPSWTDDKSLIIGAVKKIVKAYPEAKDNFYKQFLPDSETVQDFGDVLLKKVAQEEDSLLEIIKPVLKNWDHERLAIIDTILLKMAIIEMTSFETIPTKVTLNEYVEVAKKYSTAKSKDFVNGILDTLLKDLEADGKIAKSGRGLEG